MAQTKSKDVAADTAAWFDRLHGCRTIKELSDLVRGEEFQTYIKGPGKDDVGALREEFLNTRRALGNRVTFADLDGEVVTVESLTFDVSEYGDFVVIKGTRENGSPFETLTSSKPVVRAMTRHRQSGGKPTKFVFTKDRHPDNPAWDLWRVSRVPDAQDVVTDVFGTA